VPVERVALILECAECSTRWLPADEERWRAYMGGDDLDQPAELVFYCPECAERAFGGA
jgi:ribosomal protein L44E